MKYLARFVPMPAYLLLSLLFLNKIPQMYCPFLQHLPSYSIKHFFPTIPLTNPQRFVVWVASKGILYI